MSGSRSFLIGTVFTLAACGSAQPLPTSPSATSNPQRIAAVASTPSPVPATPAPRGQWLAFGDSITQDAFSAPLTAWDAAWTGSVPGVVDAGIRGVDSAYALTQADEILTNNTAATVVGLAFGTNDVGHLRSTADYQASLLGLVQKIEGYHKRVMLSTIPYSSLAAYAAIPSYNQIVLAVQASQQLPAGPDLYGWFRAHPEEIGADGIHMTADGDQAIQRLWATAANAAGF